MKKSLFILLLVFSKICFSQNVGIGTTSPFVKLQVVSSTDHVALFSGASGMYITLAEGANNRGYIGSFSGNAEDVDFGTHAANPTGRLHLVTNAAQRLTILSNGNVGIGTGSPEQLFSVNAGMVVDQGNANTGTVANTIRFGSGSGEAIGSKRTGPNNFGLDFYTQSFQRMTIANNGNIGINVAAPNSKLEIRGALGFSSTTKKWEMNYDSTAGYFYIDEFGAGRRFFIENGGNVGIGTANPNAKLDVNGDMNVANKILLNNNAGSPGQALISGGASASPGWQSLAYGNNDRFLFSTPSIFVNGSSFTDILKFNILYALSPAISYNNTSGVFTVNKSGFYRIEGSINCAGSWPVAQTGFAILQMNNTTGNLTLAEDVMPFYQVGSNYSAFKTLSIGITLQLSAGNTFSFLALVSAGSGVVPGSAGVYTGSHLSMFLVAE